MRARTHRVVTTDAEIDRAIAQGAREPVPYATAVSYDPVHDGVVVQVVVPGTLAPVSIAFERGRIQGLEHASATELADVRLEGGGTGIIWPTLDVAHYLPGLLEGVFGTARWMAAEHGRRGGEVTSLAKAKASRLNGQKGGRPRVQRVDSREPTHEVASSRRPAAAAAFTKHARAGHTRPTTPAPTSGVGSRSSRRGGRSSG